MRHAVIAIAVIVATAVPNVAWAQKPDGGEDATAQGGLYRNLAPEDLELPPDFRGRITYQGTHEAVLDRGARRGTRQYGGALTVELTFDGNAVTGRFSGTGGISSGTMSGTRNGSRCRLFETRAGDIIEGECTRTHFSAEARSQGSRNAVAAVFEAQATQFADAIAEERQLAEARREAEQTRQAEARRHAQETAAFERRLQNAPPASPTQARLLARSLIDDATNWLMNILDRESLSNVRLWNVSGEPTSLRGEYTYNGGTRGWVIARVSSGRIQCLEFHDTAGQCTPPRARQAQARASDSSGSREGQELTQREAEQAERDRARARCIAENQWRLIPGQFC
jgi:hypothetical protein